MRKFPNQGYFDRLWKNIKNAKEKFSDNLGHNIFIMTTIV